MIGVNIIQNPDEFTMAFETNNGISCFARSPISLDLMIFFSDDIAVHTWTHPYMTTLDNMQLLGEFGWTMQLIHNSTGGRLPRYWRPPYGDADNRVRAIAQEIFGLTTIIWNQECVISDLFSEVVGSYLTVYYHSTEDWSLTTGGTTPEQVQSSLEKWLTGPKSPGLIILEHELSNMSVQAFIDAFPLIGQNGWNIVSVTELNNSSPYQNADSSTSSVQPVDSVLAMNDTSSSVSIDTSSSVVASSESSGASNTASQISSSSSSSAHPIATNLGAQTQKTSSSPRSGASWGMLELATTLALISAAISFF